MPGRNWIDLTWRDFATRDMSRAIAVLPVAAIEQHGPHLPVGVDTHIGLGHAADALAAVPDDLDVLFLPLQSVGKSNEHLEYPGTITMGWETAVRAWIEIGESVRRAGCRKLAILTSHGGNVSVIDIVARELRVRHGMLVVHGGWAGLGQPEGLYSPREKTYGLHGGDFETSLMLHYRPDTVRMDRIADFPSRGEAQAQRFDVLRVTRPTGFGWMAQDLNSEGVVGEAHLASASRGRDTAAFVAERFVSLMRDVDAFDLADLPKGPLEQGTG
jgi:creatinine amidohydrolase